MDTIYYEKIQHFRPIEAPADIIFEPVTVGWYIVAGLIAVALILLLWRSVIQYRKNKYRRDSIRQVLASYTNYSKGAISLQEFIRSANTEMKRAAITTYGRENVAGLSGEKWNEFIRSKHRRKLFSEPHIIALNRVPFDSTYTIEKKDLKVIRNKVTKWIGGHHA